MKTPLVRTSFIFFCLFLVLSFSTLSQAQVPKPLRHFSQTAPSPANAIPYGNNTQAGHYVKSGDARIYYEVYGKGKPVLVLHGGSYGSTMEMGRFIDSLSQSYQVIAVSTRGHGKSEIGSAPFTYEQRANDAYAALQAVTKESALVLGFSDGAYTGYKLASMYPAKVLKLIAIGAGEMIPGPRKIVLTTQDAFRLDSLYWKQQLALMPEPERLQEMFTKNATFYNNLTVSKEVFSTIKCPVLLLSGERDQNAPLATVLAAYYMIPNSQLGIIPNAGHVAFLENFPAVWTSMRPFLKP